MSDIFGIKRLKTIEDWIDVVTTRHYKPGHSAWECSRCWSTIKSDFPQNIRSLFENASVLALRNLKIEQVYAEYPVFLPDSYRSPSKCDLMIFAEGPGNRKVVLALEAKCDEPFAQPVNIWIRTADKPVPRSQRPLFKQPSVPVLRKLRRLQLLNEILDIDILDDSTLRYQLLHRTASAILTARQTFAEAAVVIIQAFSESERNFSDFESFCAILGFSRIAKDSVIGPYYTSILPNVPLFLLYVQDRRHSDIPDGELFQNHSATRAA